MRANNFIRVPTRFNELQFRRRVVRRQRALGVEIALAEQFDRFLCVMARGFTQHLFRLIHEPADIRDEFGRVVRLAAINFVRRFHGRDYLMRFMNRAGSRATFAELDRSSHNLVPAFRRF